MLKEQRVRHPSSSSSMQGEGEAFSACHGKSGPHLNRQAGCWPLLHCPSAPGPLTPPNPPTLASPLTAPPTHPKPNNRRNPPATKQDEPLLRPPQSVNCTPAQAATTRLLLLLLLLLAAEAAMLLVPRACACAKAGSLLRSCGGTKHAAVPALEPAHHLPASSTGTTGRQYRQARQESSNGQENSGNALLFRRMLRPTRCQCYSQLVHTFTFGMWSHQYA
jgi:hypothetical protein